MNVKFLKQYKSRDEARGEGMTNKFPSWITEQMVRNIRGFNLDAYLVALEGWRRGLELTWHLNPEIHTDLKIIGFNPLGKSFSLQSETKTHYFYRSRGDKVANEAVEIASNKQKTREYLERAGINVPKGKSFHKDTPLDQIVSYGLSLGFPLVVKPTFGSLGKGVTTNITSEKQLKDSILNVYEIGYEDIIVEQYITGDDYRLYVIGEKVVGMTKRLPAHVVGDGERTIEELIELKNIERENNPYLRTKLIKVNEHSIQVLKKNNFTLKDIPEQNEQVRLSDAANISTGGDPVQAMDSLNSDTIKIATRTIEAVPGLKHAGIDILINDKTCTVIEINPTAGISMHMFPSKGNPVNIPEAIIDNYFPETIGFGKDRTKVYFNYREIRRLLRRGQVQDYQVSEAPNGPLYAKRYVISGKVQKVGYRRWIQNQARKHNLSGYTRNLKNGKVVVVVGSDNPKKVDAFKDVCLEGPRRAKVKQIKEYDWDSIICNGFYIRKTK